MSGGSPAVTGVARAVVEIAAGSPEAAFASRRDAAPAFLHSKVAACHAGTRSMARAMPFRTAFGTLRSRRVRHTAMIAVAAAIRTIGVAAPPGKPPRYPGSAETSLSYHKPTIRQMLVRMAGRGLRLRNTAPKATK